MSVLIIYATKYGCSEKCAKLVSKKIIGDVELINISKSQVIDLSKYDKIIIGGPIYMGMMNKNIVKFCNENIDILKAKKLGFFICSMFAGDKAQDEMKRSFPIDLQNIAISMKLFGGDMNIYKMNFLDKLIAKMVKKMPLESGQELNKGILTDNVDKLALDINNS